MVLNRFFQKFKNTLFKPKNQTRMKISENGLEFLKKNEGLVKSVYLDSAGLPTIGYGHLLTEFEKINNVFVNEITDKQATELLRKDVEKAEQGVLTLVKVPLSQNQFDVLVDFIFNIGAYAFEKSTLLKKLNLREYNAVPTELMKWNKARDPKTKMLVEVVGLTKRRQKEVELWQKL